jgi:hypothetical protein
MRNRMILITFLPIVVFLWLIGWSLFWIGSKTRPGKAKTTSRGDGIEILALIGEEITTVMQSVEQSD